MSSDNRVNSAPLESLTQDSQRYGMRFVLFQQNMAQKIGVSHYGLKECENIQ